MTDWKPGDRFTLEFEVYDTSSDGRILTTSSHRFLGLTMARAVKLPPKARPVRKGDKIIAELLELTFLAIHDGFAYTVNQSGRSMRFLVKPWTRATTHADGASIDWEASE